MRSALLAAFLALSGSILPAQVMVTRDEPGVVARSSIPLQVHVGGRVRARPILGSALEAQQFEHQWPGVYFEAAFVGTSVALRFDDEANNYRLLIDDLRPVEILRPGKAILRVTALASGPHRLRLEKVTESGNERGSFLGFYIEQGSTPMSVHPRQRKIEFIGDSSVTGYGARSEKQACTSDEVRIMTDTQFAYGALVAKHYDADYQINAISARGVVRNYAGILPDATIPLVYPYTFLDKSMPYNAGAWQPQVIFIKLNADFVGDLRPGERWNSFGEVVQEYAGGLGAFIAELHGRSPSASFWIWWFDPQDLGDTQTRSAFDEVQRLVTKAAQEAGVRRLEFLPVSNAGLERTACDAHYSLNDHQELARRITRSIDAGTSPW
jgi:hypothetical protein